METVVAISTLIEDLKNLSSRWKEFGGSQSRKAFEAYDDGHMGDYNKLMNTSDSYFACANQLEDTLKLRGYN